MAQLIFYLFLSIASFAVIPHLAAQRDGAVSPPSAAAATSLLTFHQAALAWAVTQPAGFSGPVPEAALIFDGLGYENPGWWAARVESDGRVVTYDTALPRGVRGGELIAGLLRISGNDWGIGYLRDGIVQSSRGAQFGALDGLAEGTVVYVTRIR